VTLLISIPHFVAVSWIKNIEVVLLSKQHAGLMRLSAGSVKPLYFSLVLPMETHAVVRIQQMIYFQGIITVFIFFIGILLL
jgi:hypothetical protein